MAQYNAGSGCNPRTDGCKDAAGLAETVVGILSPLKPDERKLLVNFLMEAGRLFRQRRE